jgi:subtilisin family serine protease
MYKTQLKVGFLVFLFLFLSIFIKVGLSENSNVNSGLAKIEPALLNAQGETSVIISFTKKPQNYKSFIKSLGGKIINDYKLMDAVSVRLDGKEISKLANMENLKGVYRDYNVSALLHESAPMLSADQVWNMGITGKDVRVCILDTGIDYTHPALEKNCKYQTVQGTNESYILQSPHSYPNNYNNTWNITMPGYTSISVHFTTIETEDGYDYVYIKGAQGNVVENFSGMYSNRWTTSVPGDTVQISLVSDGSVNDYGFYIDQVLNGTVIDGWNGCNKIINGYDFVKNDGDPFDYNGHGTHVAGIVSSDDSFYRGMANGTKLLIGKVLDSSGGGVASNIISGIDWCMNNSAQIISMSLGGQDYSGTCDDTPISQAVINAVNNGAIIVVAAGNEGINGISDPACCSKAIAVGATDKNKKVVGFSSRGPELDVLAIGANIKSTWPGGLFNYKSGTSMAAPHITGIIALMLEKNSSLSYQDVLNIFNQTSDPPTACYSCDWASVNCLDPYHWHDTPVPCDRSVTGAGIVNASRAVSMVSNHISPPQYSNVNEPADPSVYSPNASYNFNVTWTDSVNINSVILQFNGLNYTDVISQGNVYSRTFSSLSTNIYLYKWYASDTTNNWASTDSLNFTVSQAPRTCTLATDKGWSRTYDGTASSTSCSVSAGSTDGTMTFTMNGSSATSPDLRTNAGTYDYACQWTGGSNYSDCTQQNSLLTISKANSSVNLLLNNLSQDIPIEAGSTANITAVLMSGGSDIYLYQDGLPINGGTSPLTNLTEYSSVGAYNITVVYPGDENYTSSSETHFITVQNITPPTYSNVVEPPDPSVYNPTATYTFSINWTDNVAVDQVIMQMDGINYTTLKSGNTYSLTFASCQSSTPVGGGGSGHFYLTSVGPIIPLLMLISIFLSFLVRIKKKYNYLSIILVALIINLFFVSVSGADPPSCLSIRPHSYRWYANDTSGNWNSTNPMSFTINGTDPVSVYIISPENKTYSTSSVNVNYSIDSPFEISWIGYSLDNKPNMTLTGNTSLNLAEGSHNIIYYANTTWGVMNNSQRIYFTVSLPKPDLIISDIQTSGNTISYSIKNQGNANAGSSYSNLWVDGTYKTNDYLSSLTAGSSSNRAFSYSWTCSGSSDIIQVCADANNYIVESNENNNCLTKTFTCPVCTCTAWVNTYNLCTGMVNGCYYKYVRTCTNGCGQQSQCIYGGKAPCAI